MAKALTLADHYGDNRKVKCPTCGRWTSADMMTITGKLKKAKKDLYRLRLRRLGAAVCDGCRERLFRSGIGRAELYEALDGK